MEVLEIFLLGCLVNPRIEGWLDRPQPKAKARCFAAWVHQIVLSFVRWELIVELLIGVIEADELKNFLKSFLVVAHNLIRV